MYLNMGRHCVSSVIASHGDGPLSCEAKAEVAIRQVSHQDGQGHFCDCGRGSCFPWVSGMGWSQAPHGGGTWAVWEEPEGSNRKGYWGQGSSHCRGCMCGCICPYSTEFRIFLEVISVCEIIHMATGTWHTSFSYPLHVPLVPGHSRSGKRSRYWWLWDERMGCGRSAGSNLIPSPYWMTSVYSFPVHNHMQKSKCSWAFEPLLLLLPACSPFCFSDQSFGIVLLRYCRRKYYMDMNWWERSKISIAFLTFQVILGWTYLPLSYKGLPTHPHYCP